MTDNDDIYKSKSLSARLDEIAARTGMNKEWFATAPRTLFESVLVEKDIIPAIRNGWKSVLGENQPENPRVFIHGDYDVDGITAVEIIGRTLKAVYKEWNHVKSYYPFRENGYGITKHSIEAINEFKPDILFTVDCGTNDIPLREYAIQNPNVKIFVLDHHIISEGNEKTPSNFVLVNAHTFDINLSAGGLAFCFALAHINRSVYSRDDVGYAGLSTVADQMDLSKPENFALTKMSLAYLNAQIPDWAFRLSSKSFTASSFGFYIGPRINAISRTGQDPAIAAKALSGDIDAINILNKANSQRQNDMETLLNKYIPLIVDKKSDVVFVVIDGEEAKHGYLGLLASKIVDFLNRPVMVCFESNGHFSGSARGVKGIHLLNDVLTPAKELFTKFGGHEGAAGFSFDRSNLDKLVDFYENLTVKIPEIEDDSFELEDFSIDQIHSAAHASFLTEPHGNGNPEPIYSVKDCRITDIVPLKDGMYTSIIVSKNNKTIKLPLWEKYEDTYNALKDVFAFQNGESELLTIRFKAQYAENDSFKYSYPLIDFKNKKKSVFSLKFVKALKLKKEFSNK